MSDQANWYGNVFKSWQAKQLGPKPTAEQLAVAHHFGRPGKQSLALAMALREGGVTGSQIIVACGAPQNNHRTALIDAGLIKRVPTSPDGLNHTVYKVEVTPKGTKRIEQAEARKAEAEAHGEAEKPAKASKAKAKAKPAKKARKAKAEAAPETVPAEVPVIEPETPAEAEAVQVTE